MKLIERFKKEIYESGAMDIYKLIRQKVNELKNYCGFDCKMCGSCCTPTAGIFEEDFFYLEERGVNLEGVKTLELSDGSLMPQDLRYKLNKFGNETGNVSMKKKNPGKLIVKSIQIIH